MKAKASFTGQILLRVYPSDASLPGRQGIEECCKYWLVCPLGMCLGSGDPNSQVFKPDVFFKELEDNIRVQNFKSSGRRQRRGQPGVELL